jgi:hypothetical protein
VPPLLLFRYQLAFPHGYHVLLIVELMAIIPEELEEQLPERLLVFSPIPHEGSKIIVE